MQQSSAALPVANKASYSVLNNKLCFALLLRKVTGLTFMPAARSFFVIGLGTVAVLCARPAVTSAHPSIDIAVKNWSFTPATIEAHVGEPTLLRFTSSEGVHGVESADIALAKTTITPGKVTEVSFTPKTAGTFAVHCAVLCGEGHDKMVLTVKVAQ